jgi:hypothetical protein
MHPMIVADPGSNTHPRWKDRFAPLVGILAIAVGTFVAGAIGAAIGLIALLLLLQIQHKSVKARL